MALHHIIFAVDSKKYCAVIMAMRDGGNSLGRCPDCCIFFNRRPCCPLHLNKTPRTLIMKRIFSVAVLAAFTLSLLGCNTVRGVGRDVEKVGEKIEDAARK